MSKKRKKFVITNKDERYRRAMATLYDIVNHTGDKHNLAETDFEKYCDVRDMALNCLESFGKTKNIKRI